ncbi:MAG: hypothetical protein AABY26_00795 [Nanoarchaeota archaeon]
MEPKIKLMRKRSSNIRQNMVEILYYLHSGYGYQLSKIYNMIFPEVSQRLIYYHLRRGLQTKEIEIKERKQESGDFSWGSSVEKIVYALGPLALPKGNMRVKEFLEQRGKGNA